MSTLHRIASADLAAEIDEIGGHLHSITAFGKARLWHGDPQWWDYRAPILFPVIGRSPGEHVSVDGVKYPMQIHGFARDLPFSVLASEAGEITLEQRATAATRRQYPFDYRLTMQFAAAGATLTQTTTVHNDGAGPMPYCFGYHPAFLWPQEGRTDHVLRFERPEPNPVRRARMDTGLTIPKQIASPAPDGVMALADSLFDIGSIQFPAQASRSVWFGIPGQPGMTVGFPDSPQLGVWTKPGAPFLCIEPWHGLAAEEGRGDAFVDRPFAQILAPGEQRSYRLLMTFDPS